MKSGGKCLGTFEFVVFDKKIFTIYSDASDACIFLSCELLNFFSLLLFFNLYLHGWLPIYKILSTRCFNLHVPG
jgi:hypothetical protein